jgi:hypothetical protein
LQNRPTGKRFTAGRLSARRVLRALNVNEKIQTYSTFLR